MPNTLFSKKRYNIYIQSQPKWLAFEKIELINTYQISIQFINTSIITLLDFQF